MNALWLIIAIIPFTTAPVFLFLVWKSPKYAWLFLGLLIPAGVFTAFFTVYTFGGAFGPGILLFCLGILSPPVSLIVLLAGRRVLLRKFPEDSRRRKLLVAGGLALFFFCAAPLSSSTLINPTCFRLTQRQGNQIVEAIQGFKKVEGDYPTSIDELIPHYLPILPKPACEFFAYHPEGIGRHFELLQCSTGELLLTNASADGVTIERYNFTTGDWSAISFLDGACSFLR
jgi:hypothetical protein